jgi:hypothetical protein
VTVSQKAALSLLISVFLFAGFAVAAFSGLFDVVESRFYNPSITRSLQREVALDSETIQEFLAELQTRFGETLSEAAVRRSVLPNQSAGDIFERTRIYGTLLESLGGLQSVRFVDSGGTRLHFSTASRDILSQDRLSVSYRNYDDDPASLPYNQVAVPAQGEPKFILDEQGDRIILSFPFYDTFEVYRGTALFSVSVRAVAERMISRSRIKVGDDVTIISSPPGIASGLPGTAQTSMASQISSVWSDGLLTLTPLDSETSETALALVSAKTAQGIFVGRLVNETLFAFPQSMKVILLVSIFLTIYLAIFLFFNLRQDTMTIVQNRLKGLQISLIEQYYDRKGDVDWTHWTRELEQRREDIRAEVKRGIRTGTGRRLEEDIDTLIDKSWDELLSVIGGRRKDAGIDEEKLQSILNRVLQALPAAAAGALPAGTAAAQPLSAGREEPPAEDVEELAGEAEEMEELAELDEAEAAEDVETLDEAEAVDDVETLDELGEAEAADNAETLDEAETLETLDEAEAVDNAETLDETEILDEAEAVDDAEAAAEPAGAEEPPEEKPEHVGGLLAAAEKVSVREPGGPPVFDIDDVPYIDVSGAMEEMGEHIDSVLSAMGPGEEAAELEELGGDEAVDEEEDGQAEEAGPPGLSQEDIALLASEIEFSPPAREEEERDQPLSTDFEIVSPFATMLSNISIADDADQAGEAEEKEPPSGEKGDGEFEEFVDPSDSDSPELNPVNIGAADNTEDLPAPEKKNST